MNINKITTTAATAPMICFCFFVMVPVSQDWGTLARPWAAVVTVLPMLSTTFAAVLPDRLPWYFAGPALGLLVVGFFMVANQPLGATGAYVETYKTVTRRPEAVTWRMFYFLGIPIGGLVGVLLKEDGIVRRSGYDALRNEMSLGTTALVVLVGAVVMGSGARMAGGCTSGHGICGTA
ncbi:MAG: YeeE/YedE thiosulfate transporter family protein, partial [Actinomycetota bacterium]